MAAPSITYNAAGNIRAAAALVAGAPATYDIDASTKIELQLRVKNTANTSYSTTKGVRVECYLGNGSPVAYDGGLAFSTILPTEVVNTPDKGAPILLGTGKWRIVCTQLDTTYSTMVEITSSTVDGIA